jgi:hypothetical protein
MFDDAPENHDSENARAYIGALNWLRGVPGAQYGTGYSDVDPTVHEERAAELPRYLAVVSHPPGVPPVVHHEDRGAGSYHPQGPACTWYTICPKLSNRSPWTPRTYQPT